MFADILHFQTLAQDPAPTSWTFGATQINSDDVAKAWLADNETTGGVPMTGGVGAYNEYASIHAYWVDTTDMDNLGKFDGSTEDITRGGSTKHTVSSVSTDISGA